jgi:hypothetical protein
VPGTTACESWEWREAIHEEVRLPGKQHGAATAADRFERALELWDLDRSAQEPTPALGDQRHGAAGS